MVSALRFKRFKIRYIDYECLAFYNLTEFRTHISAISLNMLYMYLDSPSVARGLRRRQTSQTRAMALRAIYFIKQQQSTMTNSPRVLWILLY
jgi:hypothetical protein